MELRLDIDPLRLDEEWLGQAPMFHHFANLAADAEAAEDSAKTKLKITAATLEMEIRSNPESFGLTKSTEASISACVLTLPAYKVAAENYNRAIHNAARAAAAVGALETRKRALEKLVELLKQDYFSAPRASREARGDVDEATKTRLRNSVVRPRDRGEANVD